MSEHDDDDRDEDLVPRAHIRDLEAKAKETDELRARLAGMERDTAFSKALGPAADHPGTKYFVKGYDGELTVDAIRSAATEAGFLTTDNQPPRQDDIAAHERIAAASSGAGAPGSTPLEEAISKASSPEEVMTLMENAGYPTSRNAY